MSPTTVTLTPHGYVWRCACGHYNMRPATLRIAEAEVKRHRKQRHKAKVA